MSVMPPAVRALPVELYQLGRRVVRPRDAAGLYYNPRAEFRRLAEAGALRHLAHGYYLIPPQEALGDPRWRPEVEELALGVAASDHGEGVSLMGLSAARHHGAVPRAHATAWVAVPVNRRPLDAGVFGRIVFVARHLDRLDLVRARTTVVDGHATSVEQTIVDLARHPTWAGGADTAREAIVRLWPRADRVLLDDLAVAQRGQAALDRFRIAQADLGA